jgi:hypothetical protein
MRRPILKTHNDFVSFKTRSEIESKLVNTGGIRSKEISTPNLPTNEMNFFSNPGGKDASCSSIVFF